MQKIFHAVLPGRPIVKKNTAKHYRGRCIYSDRFREWEACSLIFLSRVWKNKKPLEENLWASFIFFFKNHQGEADVSNLIEAPQDALTKAGVIKDDRFIQLVCGRKIFGEAPRTEIILWSLGDDEESRDAFWQTRL